MVTLSTTLPGPVPTSSAPGEPIVAAAGAAPDGIQGSVDNSSFAAQLDHARVQNAATSGSSAAGVSGSAPGSPSVVVAPNATPGSQNGAEEPDTEAPSTGTPGLQVLSPSAVSSHQPPAKIQDPKSKMAPEAGILALPTQTPIVTMTNVGSSEQKASDAEQSAASAHNAEPAGIVQANSSIPATMDASVSSVPDAIQSETGNISVSAGVQSSGATDTNSAPLSAPQTPNPSPVISHQPSLPGTPAVYNEPRVTSYEPSLLTPQSLSTGGDAKSTPVVTVSGQTPSALPLTPSDAPMDSRAVPATAPGIGQANPSTSAPDSIKSASSPTAGIPTATAAASTEPAGSGAEQTAAQIPAQALNQLPVSNQQSPPPGASLAQTTSPGLSQTTVLNQLSQLVLSVNVPQANSAVSATAAIPPDEQTEEGGAAEIFTSVAAQRLSGIERLFTLAGVPAGHVSIAGTLPAIGGTPAAVALNSETTAPALQSADPPIGSSNPSPLGDLSGAAQIGSAQTSPTATSLAAVTQVTGTQPLAVNPAHGEVSANGSHGNASAAGALLTTAAPTAVIASSNSDAGASGSGSHTAKHDLSDTESAGVVSAPPIRMASESTDAAPIPASPTAHADSLAARTQLVAQVTDHLETLRVVNGRGEMTVQLQPESLGSVRLTVISDKDGVVARVVTQTTQAQQAMEGAKGQLHAALEAKGLRLQSLEVSVGNGSARDAGGAFAGPRDMPQGRAERGNYFQAGGPASIATSASPALPEVDGQNLLGRLNPTSRLDYLA